ncbi:hypothetical protein BJ742DRAFT_770880 [Cladochytrium replicatum]|nr:hypothetical protein BJ742DRAFT_770880 [Cladochytrium replicatum]
MASTVEASLGGECAPQKNRSTGETMAVTANADNFSYPITVTPLSRKPSMVVPANTHDKDFEDMDTAELCQKLREAVDVLAERERDLHVAAEIGQQLVQTNQHLSVAHNTLMRELQILSRQISEGGRMAFGCPWQNTNPKLAREKDADKGRRSSEAVVPDHTTVESWSHNDDGSRGNV